MTNPQFARSLAVVQSRSREVECESDERNRQKHHPTREQLKKRMYKLDRPLIERDESLQRKQD
jgi:hypothetical protein